jgi:hypothetical protein
VIESEYSVYTQPSGFDVADPLFAENIGAMQKTQNIYQTLAWLVVQKVTQGYI